MLHVSVAKLQFEEVNFHPSRLCPGLWLQETLRALTSGVAEKAKSHQALEKQAAEILPDSSSIATVSQEQQVRCLTLTESYRAVSVLPASCTSSEPEPVWPGTCSCTGVWVLVDLVFLATRSQVELTRGRNSPWGEIFASAMYFHCRCPIPGISNHGRQVFLLLYSFGIWIPAVQIFPSIRKFRRFIRIR